MTYYIYKHSNLSTGKSYIGCSTNPIKRWRNGRGYNKNKKFFNDIIKFGWDNFSHEILTSTEDPVEASKLEETYIRKYNSINDGYNTASASNVSERKLNTKHSKPVYQYSLDGWFIAEFPSAAEAERETGINFASISRNCSHSIKSAGGYQWSFKNEIRIPSILKNSTQAA